ncbi:MAG TPA: hypothetical protein PLU30_23610 [Verrucomicrobiae bacterium]|nr:hypothetical protein [Verrucomicrobiae bacterium]
MSSLLSSLQADIKTHLASDAFFTPAAPEGGGDADPAIAVLAENLQDIESSIAEAIAKIGICAIVLTPEGEQRSPNLPKIFFDGIQVRVRIVELVAVNRSTGGTLQPALLAAEAAAWGLHHFNPASAGGAVMVFKRIARVDSESHLIYDAIFETKAGMSAAPQRVTS